MELTDIILQLSAASGPSGFEEEARERIRSLLEPLTDEFYSDAMGNLIAVKRCGKENARRFMLEAHMDEIGFIVTGHENGFLRFATLGGIDARVLQGSEVRILADEPLYGVIGVMPSRFTGEAPDKTVSADKLFIDVGLSPEEVAEKIPVGTPAVFDSAAQRLGDEMICGKALDDRACVAILIKTMEELSGRELDSDVYCLISTQEELGTRGAVVGAFGVKPDYAIALDVTFGASPDVPKYKTLELGKAAAIGVGPNMNRHLTESIIDYAKKAYLPYQIEVLPGHSGTDAWPIQVSRGGVATALVSLPLKYMHTPIETVLISDAENIVKLLSGFVASAGEVL